MTQDPVRVPTRARPNITETLKELRVGDTVRFAVGTNYGSIRTLATVHNIRIIMRMLDSGEIEVTRRS